MYPVADAPSAKVPSGVWQLLFMLVGVIVGVGEAADVGSV